MAEMRFELDEELHHRFKLLCVDRHRSMVSVVREQIEKWVDLRESKQPIADRLTN